MVARLRPKSCRQEQLEPDGAASADGGPGSAQVGPTMTAAADAHQPRCLEVGSVRSVSWGDAGCRSEVRNSTPISISPPGHTRRRGLSLRPAGVVARYGLFRQPRSWVSSAAVRGPHPSNDDTCEPRTETQGGTAGLAKQSLPCETTLEPRCACRGTRIGEADAQRSRRERSRLDCRIQEYKSLAQAGAARGAHAARSLGENID